MNWNPLLSLVLLSSTLLAPLTAPALASDGLYYLSMASGDVRVKTRWFKQYQAASPGQPLKRSDRIWVKNSRSAAVVMCNNLTLWPVPIGKPAPVSSGCPATASSLRRRRNDLGPPRGNDSETSPVLLSPRNTAILPDEPIIFRWQPVAGATGYTLTVQDLARPVWTSQTIQSQARYTSQPSLKRDWVYSIAITTSNGASSSADTLPAFVIFSDAKAAAAKQAQQQVEALNLEPDARALALAHLYRSTCLDEMTGSTCLNQAAIEVLAARIETGTEETAIYQLQANNYQQIGLLQQAQELYRQALTQTHAHDVLLQQTEIQVQLGQIARYLGNHSEAVKWLQAAKAAYRQLSNPNEPEPHAILKQLQDWLEDSQSQSSAKPE